VLVAHAAPATLPPTPTRSGVPDKPPTAPLLCVLGREAPQLLGAKPFLPSPWRNLACVHRRRATVLVRSKGRGKTTSVICGHRHRRVCVCSAPQRAGAQPCAQSTRGRSTLSVMVSPSREKISANRPRRRATWYPPLPRSLLPLR